MERTMVDIMEHLERVRKETGETAKVFSVRMGFSDPTVYARAKRTGRVPKRVMRSIAQTYGDIVPEWAKFDAERERAEKQQLTADIQIRKRLLYILLGCFKNDSLTCFVQDAYIKHLNEVTYRWDDWTFRHLVSSLDHLGLYDKEADIWNRDRYMRQLIDANARDDAEKVALAYSVFPVCHFVYSKEEMPELYKRCSFCGF